MTKTANTEVHTSEISSVTLSRTSVNGGTSTVTKLYVNLATAAPAGGVSVALSSSSGLITLPASLVVPAGKTQASTSFTANAANAPVVVTLSGTWQGGTKSATFTVLTPTLGAFTVSPTTFVGGSSTVVNGTVTLSQAAPAGGVVVAVTCGSPLISLPSVTVAAGQTSATFVITHSSTATERTTAVFAEAGGKKLGKALTIQAPSIRSVTKDPKSLTGGVAGSATGTFTLSGPAPAAGSKVVFTTSAPGITISPASVTVPAGGTGGTFTVTAPNAVATDTAITITASYKGTKTAIFTVLAPKLNTAVVSPTNVVGGSATAVKLTVTLKSVAPTGGMVVNLSSSNSGAASVPATITIAAGQTSWFVTVTHSVVASDTPVTLTTSLNGFVKISTLTVKH